MERNNAGAVTSDKYRVWCGLELCQERDAANGALNKEYFPQGMRVGGGTKYFYTRDHLGSIREMVDSSGVTRAQYDYDAYGTRSANLITSSPVDADFGFTGFYLHVPSGLSLAPYRAYDSLTGRWLNSDPIQEAGGINLYEYVGNSPIVNLDPNGLAVVSVTLNNGQTYTMQSPTTATLTQTLSDAADFGLTVTDLRIKGHAANNVITLNDNDFLTVDATGHILDQNGTDLTGLFQAALSPTAGVDLGGCQTGRGDDSLAQRLSSALPNRVVSGGQGHFQLGIPWTSTAIGEKNYFINGAKTYTSW